VRILLAMRKLWRRTCLGWSDSILGYHATVYCASNLLAAAASGRVDVEAERTSRAKAASTGFSGQRNRIRTTQSVPTFSVREKLSEFGLMLCGPRVRLALRICERDVGFAVERETTRHA
jgi:hypothetical protein